MRILLVHNFYQQSGGEDVVFQNESELLQHYGHHVFHYTADNHELLQIPTPVAALQTIWSQPSNQQLQVTLQAVRPDVVHFHNTFMRISPSAYYVCHTAGIPVVQTLHNYRLLCPTATFYRNGQVCEECIGQKIPISSIRHACYRQSRSQSAIVTAMLTTHRLLKTWRDKVDIYIALTEFARQKFIEGGLPAEKIVTKPNFIDPDPGERTQSGRYSLFVGRLAPEKGLGLLLKAWETLPEIPLKIVGDGPMREEVEAIIQCDKQSKIEVLGKQKRETIFSLMKGAAFLVFPSEWYEGFPMTIAEAFACGLPVISATLGSMAEVIEHGQTGLHFAPGNASDLAEKVRWAWTHQAEFGQMGKAARRQYENFYTAEHNYGQLLSIYEQAIASKKLGLVNA
jgi:glycosyltransferase involved in cell wall biosynthesis